MPAFMLIPDWLEPIRILGTLLIWLMFPLQLWSIWRSNKQFHRWEEDETRRLARWQQDMEDAGKLREEAYNLRAQAEVALAMARRQANMANARQDLAGNDP